VVQVTAAPPPELLLELDPPAPLPELLALDPWPTPLLDAPLEPPKAPDELVPTPPELLVLLWPPLLLDPDDPLFPEELPDPDELLPLLLPPMSKNAPPPSSEAGGNSVVPPYGPPKGSPALLQPIDAPVVRATAKHKPNFKLRGMTCSATVPRYGAYHRARGETAHARVFSSYFRPMKR
jgi:hypothetical protein